MNLDVSNWQTGIFSAREAAAIVDWNYSGEMPTKEMLLKQKEGGGRWLLPPLFEPRKWFSMRKPTCFESEPLDPLPFCIPLTLEIPCRRRDVGSAKGTCRVIHTYIRTDHSKVQQILKPFTLKVVTFFPLLSPRSFFWNWHASAKWQQWLESSSRAKTVMVFLRLFPKYKHLG